MWRLYLTFTILVFVTVWGFFALPRRAEASPESEMRKQTVALEAIARAEKDQADSAARQAVAMEQIAQELKAVSSGRK